VIKTLLSEYASDPLFIDMLANEARICAKLSHPNLIEVFDFAAHDGIYLLAMEHVVGRPLHHILRAAKAAKVAIPTWFALRVAAECCRGLDYAHRQGVIHCDLSPSNVMVTFTGITKILDFGVAHSMANGPKADRLKGKYSYMAPERFKSLATDCRTDVYSLGVMLYLVFTGQMPFTANSEAELLYKIVHTRPAAPSELATIDPRIERLIMRAMEPDPAKRHQTVGEILNELMQCETGNYGSHDVATFVGSLFATPDAVVGELPAIPPPPPRHAAGDDQSDVSTHDPWMAAEARIEIDEVDIEDSSLLAVPVVRKRKVTPSARVARGSSANTPLERPKPLESVTKLFSNAPDAPETRTSVQSLFGDRRSLFTGGPSKMFDRLPIEPPSPPDEPEVSDVEKSVVVEEPAPPKPAKRGGFGSYSSTRRQVDVVWPWASSRTKSD
jgi:serine/threonine protein kinase